MFSRFIHVTASTQHFFKMSNTTPLYVYTFILFDEHLGCFHFLLLWIMRLWTFMYNFLCGYIFSFLRVIYLEIELLGHVETLSLSFWVLDCFPKFGQFTYSYQQFIRIQFLHLHANTCYWLFFLGHATWLVGFFFFLVPWPRVEQYSERPES